MNHKQFCRKTFLRNAWFPLGTASPSSLLPGSAAQLAFSVATPSVVDIERTPLQSPTEPQPGCGAASPALAGEWELGAALRPSASIAAVPSEAVPLSL